MNEEEYWNKIKILRKKIMSWGVQNYRNFPWRNTRNPYDILIAEIMLHRTKASQVTCVYKDFIKKYPDFSSIVEAGPSVIRNELQSLGLVWRSDMLYQLATEILNQHSGNIPLDKKKLLEFPGIGDYIASAILCFSQNLPEPILDTNTVRIIGRIFGIEVNDSSRRNKKFKQIMFDIINCKESRKISLLLIDFASLVCISGINPNCSSCQFKEICNYNSNTIQSVLNQ